ncbi:MAG: DNA polymerase III subunit delta' [Pedobacter sp.]|nr:DNA polymerase III subunit delta' [Pedobacter sp.]
MSEEERRPTWSFHPYAWQHTVWQRLVDLAESGQLPHALLISGHAGIGKERLASAFAARLLCQAPSPQGGCGSCKSCNLLNAGVHPDLMWLAPETDAKTEKTAKFIKVDQVRELVGFAEKSAQLGGYRVVIITPAHLLNVQAANALLKTLEEPGSRTLILLVSSQPLSLPATIRSRCQQLALDIPAEKEALAWLQPQLRDEATARLLLALSDGAPLAALQLRDALWFGERERLLRDLGNLGEGKATALSVAQRWQGLGAEAVLPALASLTADVAVVASGATVVKHQDLTPIITAVARRVSPAAVLGFRQGLIEKQRLLAGNVQGAALLDAVFSEWARMSR